MGSPLEIETSSSELVEVEEEFHGKKIVPKW